ncbi:MAG: hypothetical protein J0H41_07080 [Rhizobiales bacterium]|nr:hypothetical protein [Hyphomicrobiales bacterium]
MAEAFVFALAQTKGSASTGAGSFQLRDLSSPERRPLRGEKFSRPWRYIGLELDVLSLDLADLGLPSDAATLERICRDVDDFNHRRRSSGMMSGDDLADLLQVHRVEREAFGLTCFGAVDFRKAERLAAAKELKRARDRDRIADKRAADRVARGQAPAKPRALYERESLEKAKPWLALNISRATYFRRRAKPPQTTLENDETRASRRICVAYNTPATPSQSHGAEAPKAPQPIACPKNGKTSRELIRFAPCRGEAETPAEICRAPSRPAIGAARHGPPVASASVAILGLSPLAARIRAIAAAFKAELH